MILTQEIKNSITTEFNNWIQIQYAGKTKEERQEFGQFFTPPDLIIQLIEGYEDLSGTILDPTCGCGGLLAGCIIAGADPKNCYGIELDPDILKLCRERLGKLGVPRYNLHLGNALNPDCYDHFDMSYEYNPKTDKVKINGRQPFKFGFKK